MARKRKYFKSKKKNNSVIIFSIIISFVMLVWIVYLINNTDLRNIFTQENQNWKVIDQNNDENNKDEQQHEDDFNENNQYYIWDNVIKSWNISSSDNIWIYTHLLSTKNDDSIGLRSRQISLDNYTGTVKVKGTVKDVLDDKYVIEVEWIYRLKQDNDNELIEDQKDNYTFPEYGLKLNLDESPDYTVKESDWTISIIEQIQGSWSNSLEEDIIKEVEDADIMSGSDIENLDDIQESLTWNELDNIGDENEWRVLLSIRPFICDESIRSQDCEFYEESLSNARNFTDANGQKYMHISETTNWITINNNIWWYRITMNNENINDLHVFSHFMDFFDDEDILNYIEPNIWNVCTWDDTYLASIDSIELENNDGKMTANVEGTGNDFSKVICTVSIDIDDDYSMELIDDIDIQDSDNSQANSNTNSNSTSNRESNSSEKEDINNDLNTSNSTSSLENIDTDNMLEYEANLGFTMYMPNDSAYAGEMIKNDPLNAEEKWINCDYRVHVSKWTHADEIYEKSEVQVYLCKWDNIEQFAEQNNLLYKKSKETNKEFLIDYTDENRVSSIYIR